MNIEIKEIPRNGEQLNTTKYGKPVPLNNSKELEQVHTNPKKLKDILTLDDVYQ